MYDDGSRKFVVVHPTHGAWQVWGPSQERVDDIYGRDVLRGEFKSGADANHWAAVLNGGDLA